MTHVFLRTLLAVTVSASLLTACNKAETPKADTSAEAPKTETKTTETTTTPAVATPATSTTTTTTTTTTATASSKSPTVDMYVTTFKMSTVGLLNAEKPLTKEQTACLLSKEADATYYADAQTELNTILGAESIAESDKFYTTDVGKKMLAFIDQQQAKAMGQPIVGEPVVITEADKKAAADFTANNPKMKEIETKMQKAMSNPQAMMTKMQKFATQEKSRCHIG